MEESKATGVVKVNKKKKLVTVNAPKGKKRGPKPGKKRGPKKGAKRGPKAKTGIAALATRLDSLNKEVEKVKAQLKAQL